MTKSPTTPTRSLIQRLLGRPGRAAEVVEAAAPTRAGVADDVEATFARTLAAVRGRTTDAALVASLEHWSDPKRVAAYLAAYRPGLAERLPGFAGSVGLDFGCWNGFASYLLLLLGARTVLGLDVVADAVAQARAWTAAVDERRLSFVRAAMEPRFAAPLPSDHFDWAVVSQVYCSVNPAALPDVVAELSRVIRPGGLIYLNDSNNPRCPAARTRLLDLYRAQELGGGTAERPDGPIFSHRLALIARAAPDLDPDIVHGLARGTAYRWGRELDAAVEAYRRDGGLPTSTFEEGALRAVVHPHVGNAATNPTDPIEIAAAFSAHGLVCEICGTPGGPALTGAALDRMLETQQGFHLYASKPQAAGVVSGFDLRFKPYVVNPDRGRTVADVFAERHRVNHVAFGPDLSLGMKGGKVPSASFASFVDLLDGLVAMPGMSFATMRALHVGPKSAGTIPVCFKHDIDNDIEVALRMARAQAERGIAATYYVLYTAPYYGVRKGDVFERYEAMAEVYREIQSLGHEVGLHFDPYNVYQKFGIDGAEALRTELAWLRGAGLNITGAFGHSSTAILGAESVEIFRDNVAVNPDMISAKCARPDAVFEHRGVVCPRLILDARELGLDYLGEYALRGLEYGYWSLQSQERWLCQPPPRMHLRIPPPPGPVSQERMLADIARDTTAPFQIINIHPLAVGQRLAADARAEAALRKSRKSVRETGRVLLTWTGDDAEPVATWVNEDGQLDAPRPQSPAGGNGGVVTVALLGGRRTDAAGVPLPGQMQAWWRTRLRAAGLQADIRKLAHPSPSPEAFRALLAMAAASGPIDAAVLVIDAAFVRVTKGAAAEAILGLAATTPCLVLIDDLGPNEAAVSAADAAGLAAALTGGVVAHGVVRASHALGSPAVPHAPGPDWSVLQHEMLAEALFPTLRAIVAAASARATNHQEPHA